MSEIRVGIILNGVTGRMGANQHLARSIVAIRREGGLHTPRGCIMPDPILVGRNEDRLRALADSHGIDRFTTDLDEALANPDDSIFFDASITSLRPRFVRAAAEAGKAIYCEKPIAESLDDARALAAFVESRDLPNGVVQDKLWLPGIVKLRRLIDEGFFGRILSVRGEFGYWVFTGHDPAQPAQRPSWNYRAEDGGSIILDMFCHWEYVIRNLFGPIKAVVAHGATDIPERINEDTQPYTCTADDAAYAMFELTDGVICQFNSSWTTRVRRDDLLTIQVDGTEGSAVAGLRECRVQTLADTPRPVWNPDVPREIDYFDNWREVDPDARFDNAFKAQWELFLQHIVCNDPWPYTLRAGVRGVELAHAAMESWRTRRWVDLADQTP